MLACTAGFGALTMARKAVSNAPGGLDPLFKAVKSGLWAGWLIGFMVVFYICSDCPTSGENKQPAILFLWHLNNLIS
jgi:hypothetical protein